jgi:hypothetical protein
MTALLGPPNSQQQQQQQGAAAAAEDQQAAQLSPTAAAAAGGAVAADAAALEDADKEAKEAVVWRAERVVSALVTLAEALPAQRLLWLHKHGLLYGRISQELLLHVLLIQAGAAAAAAGLQYRLAAELCRMAFDPALLAAASPLLLSHKDHLAVNGYNLMVQMYQGRVLSALQAGGTEGLLQLQQLEQLQNLVRVMDEIQSRYDPCSSRPLTLRQIFCSIRGTASSAASSAMQNGQASRDQVAATAAAAGASIEPTTPAFPAVGGLTCGDHYTWLAAIIVAVYCIYQGTGASMQVIMDALNACRNAGEPIRLHILYALQLGADLGVPVRAILQRQLQKQSSLQEQPNTDGSGTSDVAANSFAELHLHALDIICTAQALLEPPTPGDKVPPEMRQLLQQHLQQQTLPSQPPQPIQQLQQRGPAPLWQLALLAAQQTFPSVGFPEQARRISNPLEYEPYLDSCLKNEAMPDAMLQQLALARAAHRLVSCDSLITTAQQQQQQQQSSLGSQSSSCSGALGQQQCSAAASVPLLTPEECYRKLQQLKEGLKRANAALQLQHPQVMQWLMQQRHQRPLLWERDLDLGELDWCSHLASRTAGQDLQADTLTDESCCPLTAGLAVQGAAAAAATAAARAGPDRVEAAPAGLAGSELDDEKRAAEIAMLVLQLQPPHASSLHSEWLSRYLDTCSGTSSSSTHLRRIARAKAVLAAVAAAPQVPAGAQQLQGWALLKVLGVGDVDLTAMLLMWACCMDAGESPKNLERYQLHQQHVQAELVQDFLPMQGDQQQQQEWQEIALQMLEQQQQQAL